MNRTNNIGIILSIGLIGFGAVIPSFHAVYIVLGLINEYTPISEYINITVPMVYLVSLIFSFVMVYGCWSYRYSSKLFHRVFQVGILLIVMYLFLSWYTSKIDDQSGTFIMYFFLFVTMVAGVVGSIMITIGARVGYHFANRHEIEEGETVES